MAVLATSLIYCSNFAEFILVDIISLKTKKEQGSY